MNVAYQLPSWAITSPAHNNNNNNADDDDDRALEIALLLSKQEETYGTNMFDSMNPVSDENDIKLMMRNGLSRNGAMLKIFERRFGSVILENTQDKEYQVPRIVCASIDNWDDNIINNQRTVLNNVTPNHNINKRNMNSFSRPVSTGTLEAIALTMKEEEPNRSSSAIRTNQAAALQSFASTSNAASFDHGTVQHHSSTETRISEQKSVAYRSVRGSERYITPSSRVNLMERDESVNTLSSSVYQYQPYSRESSTYSYANSTNAIAGSATFEMNSQRNLPAGVVASSGRPFPFHHQLSTSTTSTYSSIHPSPAPPIRHVYGRARESLTKEEISQSEGGTELSRYSSSSHTMASSKHFTPSTDVSNSAIAGDDNSIGAHHNNDSLPPSYPRHLMSESDSVQLQNEQNNLQGSRDNGGDTYMSLPSSLPSSVFQSSGTSPYVSPKNHQMHNFSPVPPNRYAFQSNLEKLDDQANAYSLDEIEEHERKMRLQAEHPETNKKRRSKVQALIHHFSELEDQVQQRRIREASRTPSPRSPSPRTPSPRGSELNLKRHFDFSTISDDKAGKSNDNRNRLSSGSKVLSVVKIIENRQKNGTELDSTDAFDSEDTSDDHDEVVEEVTSMAQLDMQLNSSDSQQLEEDAQHHSQRSRQVKPFNFSPPTVPCKPIHSSSKLPTSEGPVISTHHSHGRTALPTPPLSGVRLARGASIGGAPEGLVMKRSISMKIAGTPQPPKRPSSPKATLPEQHLHPSTVARNDDFSDKKVPIKRPIVPPVALGLLRSNRGNDHNHNNFEESIVPKKKVFNTPSPPFALKPPDPVRQHTLIRLPTSTAAKDINTVENVSKFTFRTHETVQRVSTSSSTTTTAHAYNVTYTNGNSPSRFSANTDPIVSIHEEKPPTYPAMLLQKTAGSSTNPFRQRIEDSNKSTPRLTSSTHGTPRLTSSTHGSPRSDQSVWLDGRYLVPLLANSEDTFDDLDRSVPVSSDTGNDQRYNQNRPEHDTSAFHHDDNFHEWTFNNANAATVQGQSRGVVTTDQHRVRTDDEDAALLTAIAESQIVEGSEIHQVANEEEAILTEQAIALYQYETAKASREADARIAAELARSWDEEEESLRLSRAASPEIDTAAQIAMDAQIAAELARSFDTEDNSLTDRGVVPDNVRQTSGAETRNNDALRGRQFFELDPRFRSEDSDEVGTERNTYIEPPSPNTRITALNTAANRTTTVSRSLSAEERLTRANGGVMPTLVTGSLDPVRTRSHYFSGRNESINNSIDNSDVDRRGRSIHPIRAHSSEYQHRAEPSNIDTALRSYRSEYNSRPDHPAYRPAVYDMPRNTYRMDQLDATSRVGREEARYNNTAPFGEVSNTNSAYATQPAAVRNVVNSQHGGNYYTQRYNHEEWHPPNRVNHAMGTAYRYGNNSSDRQGPSRLGQSSYSLFAAQAAAMQSYNRSRSSSREPSPDPPSMHSYYPRGRGGTRVGRPHVTRSHSPTDYYRENDLYDYSGASNYVSMSSNRGRSRHPNVAPYPATDAAVPYAMVHRNYIPGRRIVRRWRSASPEASGRRESRFNASRYNDIQPAIRRNPPQQAQPYSQTRTNSLARNIVDHGDNVTVESSEGSHYFNTAVPNQRQSMASSTSYYNNVNTGRRNSYDPYADDTEDELLIAAFNRGAEVRATNYRGYR